MATDKDKADRVQEAMSRRRDPSKTTLISMGAGIDQLRADRDVLVDAAYILADEVQRLRALLLEAQREHINPATGEPE